MSDHINSQSSPAQPGIASLFRKLGRKRFMDLHWPSQPAWHHGPMKRLGQLNELQNFGEVMTLAARSRIEIKAMTAGQINESNEFKVRHDQAFDYFDIGATLAFMGLHQWHPPTSQWCAAIAADLGLPEELCTCNLYVSPPGIGLGMHFDDHEVIVVQLGGEKNWRVAHNRTIRNPIQNSGYMLSGNQARIAVGATPKRMPAGLKIDLVPGSVLFVPRGYWHKTKAVEISVSLSFGIRVPTWAALLTNYISDQLLSDPDWREPAWAAWDFEKQATAQKHFSQISKSLGTRFANLSVGDLIGTEAMEFRPANQTDAGSNSDFADKLPPE